MRESMLGMGFDCTNRCQEWDLIIHVKLMEMYLFSDKITELEMDKENA